MKEHSTIRIGWVGLGNFGLPIAQRAAAAGYEVVALVLNQRGRAGASHFKTLEDPHDLREFDLLVMCLPRASDVVAVLDRYRGKLPSLVIDLTSGDPAITALEHERLGSSGTLLIDAPVSGSKEAARQGRLTIFVGAHHRDVSDIGSRLLDCLGSPVTYFGAPGAGHAAKLINQFMHLSIMGLISDALVLGRSLELDAKDLMTALSSASGGSKMLDRFGESILAGDYTPLFTLELASKDLDLVERLAQSTDADTYYLRSTLELFRKTSAIEGRSAMNFSIVCLRE